MRNDQEDNLLNLCLTESEMGMVSDYFFAEVEKHWNSTNTLEKEWQDLGYWEVAQAVMNYMKCKQERLASEAADRDLYEYWASER